MKIEVEIYWSRYTRSWVAEAFIPGGGTSLSSRTVKVQSSWKWLAKKRINQKVTDLALDLKEEREKAYRNEVYEVEI